MYEIEEFTRKNKSDESVLDDILHKYYQPPELDGYNVTITSNIDNVNDNLIEIRKELDNLT